jgi:3-deoxy-7-phosphoheptulonate synthase
LNKNWSKSSWKNFPVSQQPSWPNSKKHNEIIEKLNSLPSIVFSGETRNLRRELSKTRTNNFILQIGPCAENFNDCTGPFIHNFLRVLLQMSAIIESNTQKKIIRLGRIAGQYAKPRSSNFEDLNGQSLLSYRGDMVNSFVPIAESRIPNSDRLLEGYFHSVSTLNLIRAFIQGGYSDLKNILDWKEHAFRDLVINNKRYGMLETELSSSSETNKLNREPSHTNFDNNVYISHEGLLLDYEEAFTRIDTTTGKYYNTSAHLLWIGERTRGLKDAHVEYMSGIENPIGIKVGPNFNINELIEVIKKINPLNQDDKIILIIRMGKDKIEKKLLDIIVALKASKLNAIYSCDPMHGNTFSHDNYKVRSFDSIKKELILFFKICYDEGVMPGGVHLEVTGEDVTECIGGPQNINYEDLSNNYLTTVDPRLNASQAVELAFIICELLKK